MDQAAQQASDNAKASFSQAIAAGAHPLPAWHAARNQYLHLQGLPKPPAVAPQEIIRQFHLLQDNGPGNAARQKLGQSTPM
jgi:hypothetical protein